MTQLLLKLYRVSVETGFTLPGRCTTAYVYATSVEDAHDAVDEDNLFLSDAPLVVEEVPFERGVL